MATMFPGAALILTIVALVVPGFFLVMWLATVYRRLAALRNGFRRAYAPIDAQLRRRYELIPDLVETGKGYLHREQGSLEAVQAARNAAFEANARAARLPGDPTIMKELSGTEQALRNALSRLFAAAESLAGFKSNGQIVALKAQLTAVEKELAIATQAYNDQVMKYNALRGAFPNNLIARPLSFTFAGTFTADSAQRSQAAMISSS